MITELERQVMQGILDSEYADGNPGDEENGSAEIWAWSIRCKVARSSIPGVVASLVKKGLVRCQDGDTKKEDTLWLTGAGVKALRES